MPCTTRRLFLRRHITFFPVLTFLFIVATGAVETRPAGAPPLGGPAVGTLSTILIVAGAYGSTYAYPGTHGHRVLSSDPKSVACVFAARRLRRFVGMSLCCQ